MGYKQKGWSAFTQGVKEEKIIKPEIRMLDPLPERHLPSVTRETLYEKELVPTPLIPEINQPIKRVPGVKVNLTHHEVAPPKQTIGGFEPKKKK